MIVYPTSNSFTLTYSPTLLGSVGNLLTLLGLGICFVYILYSLKLVKKFEVHGLSDLLDRLIIFELAVVSFSNSIKKHWKKTLIVFIVLALFYHIISSINYSNNVCADFCLDNGFEQGSASLFSFLSSSDHLNHSLIIISVNLIAFPISDLPFNLFI